MQRDRQRTVVILQSGYLPWLGFFDQLNRADLFVLYDDTQYTRRDWRNRNRIASPNGPIWLTVPVYQKGHFNQLIKDTRIVSDTDWGAKHLATIAHNYSRASYFEQYFGLLEGTLSRKWDLLTDLNLHLIKQLAGVLGIERRILRSSDLDAGGAGTQRLLNICLSLEATKYLSGDAAESYLEREKFEEAGIAVEFHRYNHPTYRQVFGGFIPYMSVIDLLFNEGPGSLAILTSGNSSEGATCKPIPSNP